MNGPSTRKTGLNRQTRRSVVESTMMSETLDDLNPADVGSSAGLAQVPVHRRLPRAVVLIVTLSGVIFLSAMTSSREVMNPEIEAAPAREYPVPVELRVRGATAGIQPDYFEESLAEAIVQSKVFADIDDSTGKPYALNVRIVKVDAPTFSFRMAVDMNAVWDLVRTTDGTRILHEKIHSTYTGGAFEGGLIGANRVRAATEGAARENIRIGLEKIASLDLEP